MDESTDNTNTDENTTLPEDQEFLQFWLSVLGGTMTAGGVFGSLFVGVDVGGWAATPGFFGGVLYGGVVGLFIIANVAFVTWCFWLSRYRVAMAGLTGGLTGFAAMLIITSDPPAMIADGLPWRWFALAGLLGTVGGGLAGHSHHSRSIARGHWHVSVQHRWRFTLRDLFIRVTVFSVLLTADIFLINLILTDHP